MRTGVWVFWSLGILFLPNHPTPEHPDCLILRMLKAIVFDYNGTLVDDLDLAVESYYRAGTERGYRLSRETVLQHISQPPSAKRGLYFGNVSDAEWAAIIERRKAVYADLARSVFKLFPQTESVLIALASRYRLGVLSNTFRDLFERLFPAHLAALFQASLFFGEVPDPKPSPAPMRAMLRTLGVDDCECGYVGDAIEDVQMARAAGVRSFALPTGACSSKELRDAGADWVGPDLGALLACLVNGNGSEKA
jgi:phosphoglycolate phosphatase-like HAD superfamily hydrolase